MTIYIAIIYIYGNIKITTEVLFVQLSCCTIVFLHIYKYDFQSIDIQWSLTYPDPCTYRPKAHQNLCFYVVKWCVLPSYIQELRGRDALKKILICFEIKIRWWKLCSDMLDASSKFGIRRAYHDALKNSWGDPWSYLIHKHVWEPNNISNYKVNQLSQNSVIRTVSLRTEVSR